MGLAFVFPGQGSQKVGMGRALAEQFSVARQVFEEVQECLSQRLTSIMFEGPEDALTLTENAQPAIMALSIAAFRVLEEEVGDDLGKRIDVVAGHSLGEYSALVAAGSLALGDCAKLLRIRGQAMQQAVAPGEGAMAAILGLDKDAVEEICRIVEPVGVCDLANDNAPGQIVVSGHRKAVEAAVEKAREAGARRAVFLSVSAPFHCRLMEPARRRMEEELATITFRDPLPPLISNVEAAPVKSGSIPRLLATQVEHCVRWRESIERICHDGGDQFIECGPGKVLGGLIRRISRNVEIASLERPEDVEIASLERPEDIDGALKLLA